VQPLKREAGHVQENYTKNLVTCTMTFYAIQRQ
jgi:hypothetical protein